MGVLLQGDVTEFRSNLICGSTFTFTIYIQDP